jgi:nicotinamide-nucleotide amidase
MKAHILTIGDELLIGQTVDANAAWLGEQFSLLGIEIVRSTTVGDTAHTIHTELDRAFEDADLVVTTGGLGPTHDDLTREVVADYFGVPLRVNETLMQMLRDYYERRGRSFPEAARKIALVPAGFELMDNPVGTAPGLWYASANDARMIAVLPGIPQEMKAIAEAALLPRLRTRGDLQTVEHRTLLTTGVGESSLQEKVGDLSEYLDDALKLAYLPSTSGVRMRLTAYGDDRAEAQSRIKQLEQVLRERVGRYIFGTGDDELEAVLGDQLRERGLTVATAESCTGGFVAHRLTNVSGSSDYFVGSVVSYANRVKVEQLGVDPDVLAEHGAVSEPVARQMAQGVRTLLGANIGVSTTGIAGPTGGTPDKPVGTIWVGYADAQGDHARRLQFVKDRTVNKELFSTSALEMIRRQLQRRAASQEPA